MKIAIYARVSTNKQEAENQVQPLLEFAKKRNYDVFKIYQDVATGKNRDRKEFNEMMSDAHQRKFEAILVWALDRLSREGLYKTVNLLEHLNQIGVGVVSYTEQYLDTTNEMFRNIMIALLSTLAKAERDKISERTRAGLERVRKNGTKLGRPVYIKESLKKRAIALVKAGHSLSEAGRRTRMSRTFVRKLLSATRLGGSAKGRKAQKRGGTKGVANLAGSVPSVAGV